VIVLVDFNVFCYILYNINNYDMSCVFVFICIILEVVVYMFNALVDQKVPAGLG
jgi:hypothetical protein